MDTKALISIAIFLFSYILIVREKAPRVFVALSGGVLLILFKVYTPQEVALYVNWDTIGFLFGIFITVKITEKSGFFNYFALLLSRKLDFSIVKIFIFFPLMAALLSGFIDSISVIAFLVPLTYALSKILKFNPVPLIITEISLANIGGAGTLMGNPPNVILGSMFGLGFTDFLRHNWIISVAAAFAAISVSYALNRKELLRSGMSLKKEELKKISPDEAIEDRFLMKAGIIGLVSTIVLLVLIDFTHDIVPVNISLASLIPAFTILTLKGNNPKLKNILNAIDIETLLFLAGLFVIVGSLEKTGVMGIIASYFTRFAGDPALLTSILFWGSAFSSGLIDNIPEAIAAGYIIQNLMPALAYSFTILVWGVSLGLDIGGNFTPIGAGANVIGYTFMEKHNIRISWWRWIRLAFLPNLAALIVCWAGLLIKIRIGYY